MKGVKKGILLVVAILFSSSLVFVVTTRGQEYSPPIVSSRPSLAGVLNDRYVDPDLLNASGPTRVLIVAGEGLPPHEVAQYMISSRFTPFFNGLHIIVGMIDAEKVNVLARNPQVLILLKDRKIDYGIPTTISPTDLVQAHSSGPLGKLKLGFRDEAPSTTPETTLREVANITGAEQTWTGLEINGTGVTIAIVDTGVDYGALSLGYWDSVARDERGYPAAFDADAECMVLTNTTVTAYMNGTRKFLNTSGTDPDVYSVVNPSLDLPLVTKLSTVIESLWPYDMEVTGIDSLSGDYHFGIMVQSLFGVIDLFPVLVVDSTQPGKYDTVYVDLSFDWWWWDFTSVLDASFADEPALTPTGRTIAARDFTGDGVYDVSAGSLGYFLDVWGVSPNANDRGLILKPLDPAGNYAVFVNDWWGHGTQCASSAGGRDGGPSLTGPGTAPEAKIMGIVALWIGDLIEAELWAAGFDLIPGTEGWSDLLPGYGTVWGTWNYTGNHKADVISNSWGISDWAPSFLGLPWYDVLTIFEDALMVPGYLDPQYPGTAVVHAGGNGAPGYGTFTSPGYATLPISVGASTSFATTAGPLFNVSGGYYDDVISWSAMGPTPLGTVKPDVVNVGAWAMVPGPVWTGSGNGSTAFNAFGGTSMATPLTAGAVGLVIHGYTVVHGEKPTPETTKIILKSTARDLGYDAFLQGSGRVDCFAATALALETSGITLTSPITWENVRSRIQYAWFTAHDSFGDPLRSRPPTPLVHDASWYAGVIHPNTSVGAEFTMTNPTNHTIRTTITPVVHEQVGTTTIYSGNTSSLEGWLEGYGDHRILNISEIPLDADLMIATLMVPFIHFDPESDYEWNHRFRIFILDWIDANGNDAVELPEVSIINYGYDTGTICEGRVGFPHLKFKGHPVIWISQASQTPQQDEAIPYEVHISYYTRTHWTWVTTPHSLSVRNASSETFTATLTVPPNTVQGIYEGQILVNITAPHTRAIAIPVSVAVPQALSSKDLTLDLAPPPTTALYDPYRVTGHFDWRWRYEAGDWKQWILDIQDPTIVAAFISSNWTGTMTDIDMFGINPLGILVDGAMSPHMDNGRFRWQTRTGTTEEYVVLDTTAFTNPLTGVYTVLLHNVLYDGTSFPEPIAARVELVTLTPQKTQNLVTRPGSSASQNFTLTTGRTLTNLTVSATYPFTPFPVVDIVPSSIPTINAMNVTEVSVNVEVPEATPDGTYQVILAFTSRDLPVPVYAAMNIAVDTTPPTISLVSPKREAIIGGTITIDAYTPDPNAIDTIEFTVGTTSTPMTFNPSTGHWTGSLDTTVLPDGRANITVRTTDTAGNRIEEKAIVTVDNTPPAVNLVSPAAETRLTGTVTITFEATDPHLASAELIIDNRTHTVTGETVYHWDTLTIGDGAHTLRLVAFDTTGNTATTQITVTTMNTHEATAEAYTTGRTWGLVIGALIGGVGGAAVAVAVALARRRK